MMLNSSSGIRFPNRIWIGVILALTWFVIVSCGRSELGLEANAQSVPHHEEPDRLGQIANQLAAAYAKNDCKEFANAFPTTFDDFDGLYGYVEGKGPQRLYLNYEEHIPFFINCPSVTDHDKLSKIISIGINGKWEADASALIQDAALKLIISNPDYTKQILDSRPETEASSFWYFLFDGPHPGDKEVRANVERVILSLGRHSKQSGLLRAQYQELLRLEREDK